MLNKESCFELVGTPNNRNLSRLEFCPRHGHYIAFLFDVGQYTGCPTCGTEDNDSAPLDADVVEILKSADLSERLIEATFESFQIAIRHHSDMLSYVVALMQLWANATYVDCGQLIFLGKRGAGKTHIAIASLKMLSKQGHSVYYADLQSGLAKVPVDSGLLVLDGVFYKDVCFDPIAVAHTNQIIHQRATSGLPTILLSDQSKEGFLEQLSPRTLESMRRRSATIINFDWEVENFWM